MRWRAGSACLTAWIVATSCGDPIVQASTATDVSTSADEGGSSSQGGVGTDSTADSTTSAGSASADSSTSADTTAADPTDGTTSTTTDASTSTDATTTGGSDCVADPDCETGNVCVVGTCDPASGTCLFENLDGQAPAGAQTSGDCTMVVCDQGTPVDVDDDTDLPVDGDDCTEDLCTAGVPSNPPAPEGTMCGAMGLCDGAGACVGCITPADCTGLPPNDECQTRTCEAGVCGQDFTPADTPVMLQTTGNCQEAVCDGAGGVTSIDDDGDVPIDGLECTEDVCDAGMPSNPPVLEGTACGTNGVCDDAGQCIGCITAADCAGQDTFCQAIACNAGVCGVDNTPLGVPLPDADQTDNDCQIEQCDGNGQPQSVADDADLPVDTGAECTEPACTAGVPSQAPLPGGTACGDATDTACTNPDTCNGAGTCVPNHAGAGAACGDQGVDCRIDDTCNGSGGCVDNGTAPAGTACGDSSDTACTDPDTCNPAGTCVANHAGAGAACGDQGVACRVDDACNGSGGCTDNGFAAIGTACGDGADTECTDPDSCDAAGVCAPNHAAPASPCGDQGVDCFADDICDGNGACFDSGFSPAGTDCGDGADTECTDPDTCNDAGVCEENHAPGGTACDNGTFCDGLDECFGNGQCVNEGPLPCAAGEVCIEGTSTCLVPITWINELHYDNTGGDTGEFVEVAVPVGVDVATLTVTLYEGNDGLAYQSLPLSGFTAGTTVNGITFHSRSFSNNSVQNGPDGLALSVDDGSGDVVLEFLSYEGTFTANDGPASGMLSVDIGVAEGGSDPPGLALGLTGAGSFPADFTWAAGLDDSPGAVNVGQTINP